MESSILLRPDYAPKLHAHVNPPLTLKTQNNPLHISIFPSYNPLPTDGKTFNTPLKSSLQFSLLLSSVLDIFDAKISNTAARSGTNSNSTAGQSQTRDNGKLSGELGLLTVVDERLSVFGHETNTGTRFVVVVDVRGRSIDNGDGDGGRSPGPGRVTLGVREADVKPVFKAMQAAYVRLLQNPFYEPDEHCPPSGKGGKRIESRKFDAEMTRIGEGWGVGVASF